MSQQLPASSSDPTQWPVTTADPPDQPRFAYHRLMKRDPNYRWWRPLAVGSTSLGFFLILLLVILVAMVVVVVANPSLPADPSTSTSWETDPIVNMTDPAEFILTMLSLIIIIPSCFLGYLLLGPKRVGMLLSVTGKLRFKWLGICALASLVIYVLFFGSSLTLQAFGVLPAEQVPAESIPANPGLMILLVLLLVPFQAAAEEYLFRGMLMQIIGSWLKHPLFAILIPIPLFVIGHLYDLYGQLDVAFFALAAGYLTWRTGGLEAAIGLHTVNNVVLFLLGSVGLLDVTATESSLGSLIVSLCLTTVVTALLVYLAKRFKIERTAGPAPVPPPPHYLVPWSTPHLPGQPPYDPATAPYGYYQQTGHPSGAYWAPPVSPPTPGADAMPPHEAASLDPDADSHKNT